MDHAYLYVVHVLCWFCLAAVVAIFANRGRAITLGGAAVLGLASWTLQNTLHLIGVIK